MIYRGGEGRPRLHNRRAPRTRPPALYAREPPGRPHFCAGLISLNCAGDDRGRRACFGVGVARVTAGPGCSAALGHDGMLERGAVDRARRGCGLKL